MSGIGWILAPAFLDFYFDFYLAGGGFEFSKFLIFIYVSTTTMATGVVYHEIFLEHGETWHPENRRRLEAIVARLKQNGLWNVLEALDVYPATEAELQWLHDAEYIEEIKALSQKGGGQLDPDTIANWATWGAAITAAGSCMAAVEDMLTGGVDNALCLVRPPGHHARPSQAMGFCFFNNAALAAEFALRHGLRRVAIFDFDVHHGNGTQEMFYHRGDVLYISIHQREIYPGTGTVDEAGVDAGLGRTVNIPLPAGAQNEHYWRALTEIVLPALRRYKPEFIIVSAGFDGHHADPLAQHELTSDIYYHITKTLRELAEEICEGRLCVCLEGGYALEALAHGIENTTLALLSRPLSEPENIKPSVHPAMTARVEEFLNWAIKLHTMRLDL